MRIIKCQKCGEEYDTEMFPYCPYCMARPGNLEIIKESQKETFENNSTEISLLNSKDSKVNSKHNDDVFSYTLHKPRTIPEFNDIDSRNKAFVEKTHIFVDAIIDGSKSLNNVGLSNRLRNVLFRNSIFTIDDLQKFLRCYEVSSLKGIGSKTLKELDEFISTYIDMNSSDLKRDNTTNNLENMLIAPFFNENKYNLFVKYCNDNGISTIKDLENFDFNKLIYVHGFGTKKLNDVINRYKEISSNGFESKINQFQSDLFDELLFKNINEELKNLDINFLYVFNIKSKQLEKFRLCNINKLCDLEGISLYRLTTIVSKRNIDKYQKISQYLQYNLVELLDIFLTKNSQTEKNEYFAILYKSNGYTLNEIGKISNVTRERARQWIVHFMKKLSLLLEPIFDSFFNEDDFISLDTIQNITTKTDFIKIITYWGKHSDYVQYLDYADVFLPKEINITSIEENLIEIAEDFVGDGILINEHLEELSDLIQRTKYSFLDEDSMLNFMQKKGYTIYGNYLVKGRESYGAICAHVVAEKFPDGIQLYNHNELNILRKYITNTFVDINIAKKDRAFSARLANYLVLCGRGKYISKEKIYVETEMLNDIKTYIDDQPDVQIYYSDLYERFKGLITMESSIDNYHYLHGVLKLYYSPEYDFSNRDYLSKRGEGLLSRKFSDRLNDFIIKKGRPVHKKEIEKEFPGVTYTTILNTYINDKNIFLWDYNLISTLQLIDLDDKDKEYLKISISEIMKKNNGYCSDNMLYTFVSKNNPDIIQKNKMSNSNNLYFTCAKILSKNFKFRRPHICSKGVIDDLSVQSIVTHLLGEQKAFNYNDIIKLGKKYQWAPTTVAKFFDEFQSNFVRMNEDYYIKKGEITFSEVELKNINSYLLHEINIDGFVSLRTIQLDKLPDIKYDWNNYLLRSIIDNYLSEFKVIEPRSRDRRYEKGIIIHSNSNIKDYSDLVVWILKRNHLDSISERDMLSFLVLNGLTYKIIPKELYFSNKLIFKEEVFYLK